MRYYIIILLLLTATSLAFAQEWEVPEDRMDRLSTFEFSETSVSAGERVYTLNCKSCHGDPGKANYQALNPVPGDPVSDKIQHNSDGALQFKISEGKGLMPSFKRILTPDDIWNLISYIRSYNQDYKQTVGLTRKLTNLKWSEIKILINLMPEEHHLVTKLIGLEGDKWTPVPDTEVRLLVKRYFGSMQLDNPRLSDNKGEVVFDVSGDLPGDSTGMIDLTVQLGDIELFGDIRKDTSLNIGVASYAPPLNLERAMWNVNRKAPLWLIFAYFGVVLTVWGFIFYVLFKLRDIHREGGDEK